MKGQQHYKRAAAQMFAIRSEFMSGASVARLSRKHSLPASLVEFIIRAAIHRLAFPVVTPAGRALIGAGPHEPALPSRTGQRV